MSQGSARIDSPEVIREFRKRFVTFDQAARQSLQGVDSDLKSTLSWLGTEQRMHWKQQVRKREEAVNLALRELNQCRMGTSYGKKSSCIDEQKALEKARRLKEEAERKIEVVTRWTHLLQQKAGKLRGPCIALSILLDGLTPRALARLDRMLDNLEEYFIP